MLNEEELKDAALLVFANKQDQPGAKGAGDISEALRLGELRDRNWSIMACSAVDGSGVNEGMDWLVVCTRACAAEIIRLMVRSQRYPKSRARAPRMTKTNETRMRRVLRSRRSVQNGLVARIETMGGYPWRIQEHHAEPSRAVDIDWPLSTTSFNIRPDRARALFPLLGSRLA